MTLSDRCAVLVTSASAKVPLVKEMMRAVRSTHLEIRVVAGDLNAEAITRYVADDFWVMPPVNDANLNALLDGCRRRGIHHVLPTRDGELRFWSTHAPAFAAERINVWISSQDAVDRCIDKLRFARECRALGLPTIAAVASIEELEATKFVVKERFGAGSKGIGLNLECQEAIAHSRKMMEPVFQPFIQGSEISIDCWMERSGAVKGVVLRRRDEVRNGESRITTTFRDKALESAAVQWFSALKLRGHAVMQVLIDENRQPRIIECNARFGGASTASIAAGLSSLRWSLLESSGQDVTHEAFIRRDGEIRQIRIPTDIHIHDYRF